MKAKKLLLFLAIVIIVGPLFFGIRSKLANRSLYFGLREANFGNYTIAMEAYQKTLRLKPDYFLAYKYIGDLYEKQGMIMKAFEAYDKAATLNPYYAPSFNARGLLFYKAGRMDKAIEDYSKAIKMDPTNWRSYFNRATANLEQDETQRRNFRQALKDYSKSLELNPENAEGYYLRGILYYSLRQPDLAFSDYVKAVEIKPELKNETFFKKLTWSKYEPDADINKTVNFPQQ